MTKLCWNAIVRDESARIERCMLSLVDHITSYVVADTGSTDGTPDIIRKFFADRGIPGEIHHTTFVNFEQARNVALDAARRSPLDFDYMLLVDADMELAVERPDWCAVLGDPSYDMQQRAGTLHYHNRRLVRKNTTGKYIGVTHEYLDVPTAGTLEGAYFVDHADGANREGKYDRDIALLSKALEADPNNGRSWFYLAQSYRDAGKHELAANAYLRCVRCGGWDEQLWNAQLNYAHCLESMGDEGGFIREMMVAYNMRPSRAETLYDLAKHYRVKGMNAASIVFSEIGLKVPYPKDGLFVSDYVYKTGFRDEFSICGFYDPVRKPRAFAMCSQLALDRNAPQFSRDQARANLYHYIEPLAKSVPYFVAHRIPFTPPDGYIAMNPSVTVRGNGEIVAVVRTVNYTITDSGHYAIRGGDGSITDSNPIHTRNFLVHLNDKFEVTFSSEIELPMDHPEPKYGLVRGLEDMRLIEFKDSLWINACVREMNEEGWCEQMRGRLGPDGRVHAFQRMLPKERSHEKNWMPVIQEGELRYVYRLGTVVRNDASIAHMTRPRQDTEHVSGGSQVASFDGAHLAVVHEARVRPDNGQRYYQHRFVQMTAEGVVLLISRPFVLHDRQIEFVAGLAVHPDGQRLMISYGVRDREAWIATIDKADVWRLF